MNPSRFFYIINDMWYFAVVRFDRWGFDKNKKILNFNNIV